MDRQRVHVHEAGYDFFVHHFSNDPYLP